LWLGFNMTRYSRLASIAILAPALAVLGTAVAWPGGIQPIPASADSTLALSVAGNQLVDSGGHPIVLRGVNRPSPVYACIQGTGIFDGPADAASVAAIASWNTNAVRIQLNEDCWLNINLGSSGFGGATYQNAIQRYVSLLHQQGLYVILSLGWNAPGTTPAVGQQVMADADHAPAFWQSVASVFNSDPAVLFDLYNEPHDISWACWRDGCTTANGWPTAGMQTLVNAVRGTGATQPILLGGLAWADDLSQWLQFRPNDPANALIASFHVYGPNWNACVTLGCWENTIKPVLQQFPVVAGEIGENDCAHGFIDPYMAWADLNGVSYLGFSWEAWTNPNACATGPTLISAYDGTPTNQGIGLRDHLATLAKGLSVSVAGNRLVDGIGRPLLLHGVGRVGALYPCIYGWGIFDGPTDSSSVAAIVSWHTNAVRLQLNEDCWLGINGVNPAYGAAAYQNAIAGYVKLLHVAGLYVILSLAWNAPGATLSTNQQMMADADHAPAFWSSVASTFKSDNAILFDLYSTPHDITWSCWLAGCNAPGWQTAGMQTMISAVRGAGANQPIMLSGDGWASDLSGWLNNRPSDPANALVASVHSYNTSGCGQGCWSSVIQPVAAVVPTVTAELNENDCAHGYIDSYMAWADANSVSYLGSTWEAWAGACASGPTLIAAYDGTATGFGVGLRDHLAVLGSK
jgi:hypothetical protein